jgi:hypothetical protein
MPGCGTKLVVGRPGFQHFIGEVAHIIGATPDGPRGDASFPPEELNRQENLLILCPSCHSKVDANVQEWPVQRLREIKQAREGKATGGVEWRPFTTRFAAIHYVNVERMLMLASLKGISVNLPTGSPAEARAATGIVIPRYLALVQTALLHIEQEAIPLKELPFHRLPVGAMVSFNRGVYARNISGSPRDRVIALTGYLTKDPHIYIKRGGARITMVLKPSGITSETAFSYLQGMFRLAGLFQIKGRAARIGKERLHLMATPIILGVQDWMHQTDEGFPVGNGLPEWLREKIWGYEDEDYDYDNEE